MAILITGGSSGIGRGVGEHFAGLGHDVFINYHSNDAAAQEAAAAVEQRGGTPHLMKADVGSIEGVQGLMEEVAARTDRLDQIVHCPAKIVRGRLLEIDPEQLAQCIAVNALSLVGVVRGALPLLQRGSTVFYITAVGAVRIVRDYGAMGVPKALGEHIVRYLAAELAPRGVRIYNVSVGGLDTQALRDAFPADHEKRLAAAAKANRMGRPLEFGDVSGVIEMLSRPEFEMVVGERIQVDGGVYL